MKRTILALMTLMLLMSTALALPAWAETVTRDGIEVTLTTEKESYDSIESVNAYLTITNTNSYAVENVSSEITAPNGYVLRGDTLENLGKLKAGQSRTQETTVYDEDDVPKLPKTGDNSHLGYWTVLFLLCMAGVCALARNSHARRFLSLLLCAAILSPYALHAVPARAQTAESAITIKKNVAVAGKSVTLTGTVKYEAPASSVFAMRAGGETPASELAYVKEGNEITITGYTGSSDRLVIPEYIDGKPVTKIGYDYRTLSERRVKGVDNVRELVLPDTVKRISANAFEGCVKLESIRFSQSLSYIGGQAFVGCDSLTEVNIHTTEDLNIAGVVDENGGTFAHCDNLKTVNIECDGDLALAGDSIFINCAQLEEVSLTASKYLVIGKHAFEKCEYLYDVKIKAKDGANIRDYAFCSTALNTLSLQVEGSVTLGNVVFANCTFLKSLTLLSNVTSIGYSAFMSCGYNVGGFTIRGNRGSYVEKYVEEQNARVEGGDPRDIIKFVAIEDEVCDHSSGRHYTSKDSDREPGYELDKYDQSSHPYGHRIVDYYTRYCSDCNKPLQVGMPIYREGVIDPHQMVNGVCSLCGYTEEPKQSASIAGFEIDEKSAMIGSSVHVKSGTAYSGDYYLRKIQISVFTDESGDHGYYSDVSKEFAYGEATSYDLSNLTKDKAIEIKERFTCHGTEEEFPAGEAMVMVFVSVYNEDGTAGENKFGAKAAATVVVSAKICEHPTYTDVYNENIPIRYTDNNDGKTHIWQNGYDRICDTCQETLGIVYGEENEEDHDYTDGDICPCGYDRNNCQHVPSEVKIYNHHIFAPFDEKQHQTTAIVWDMVCSICEKIYEEIDTVGDENNPIGRRYDHKWENGKCTVVGCEYECRHPEFDRDGNVNYTNEDYISTVSIKNNNDGKTHTHMYIVNRTCSSCQGVYQVTVTDDQEEHNEEGSSSNTAYLETTSDQHKKVTTYYCGCGEVVKVSEDWEDHVYEDRVCSCGKTAKVPANELTILLDSKYFNPWTKNITIDVNQGPVKARIWDEGLDQWYEGTDYALQFELISGFVHYDNNTLIVGSAKETAGAMGKINLIDIYEKIVVDSVEVYITVLETGWGTQKETDYVTIGQVNEASNEEFWFGFGDKGFLIENGVQVYNFHGQLSFEDMDKYPNGYYNVSFDVYNRMPIRYGVSVYNEKGEKIGETQIINGYNTNINLMYTVESVGKDAKDIITGNVGNWLKGESESNQTLTKIQLEVPTGGYIKFEDGSTNEDIFYLNAAYLLLSVYDAAASVKALANPTKLDGKVFDMNTFAKELRKNNKYSAVLDDFLTACEKAMMKKGTEKVATGFVEAIIEVFKDNESLVEAVKNSIDISEVGDAVATGAANTVGNIVLAGNKPAYVAIQGLNVGWDFAELIAQGNEMLQNYNGSTSLYIERISAPGR